MIIGLLIIFVLVLFLPFSSKAVEQYLEIFLFAMGLLAATVSGQLQRPLFLKALEDPINLSLAVFIAGLLFKWFQTPLEKGIYAINQKLSTRFFMALLVVILGFISSIITAIISALILVMIASTLRLDNKSEQRFVILACFSIGLGAALTPIGEPLSTIATSKLNEDFFFLLRLIGPDVMAAILLLGVLTIFLVKPKEAIHGSSKSLKDSYQEILIRTGKIYLFVMGLTLLGAGFEPLIHRYIIGLSPLFLYWVNMVSAILDNATLTAAEISPVMDHATIRAILLGLLISGGMLIPGNIPNIIAAGKLQITSKEWARFGFPLGLSLMMLYFIVILLVK